MLKGARLARPDFVTVQINHLATLTLDETIAPITVRNFVKLANEGFVAKAPAAVVEGERAKLAKYQENLEGVKAALEKLK